MASCGLIATTLRDELIRLQTLLASKQQALSDLDSAYKRESTQWQEQSTAWHQEKTLLSETYELQLSALRTQIATESVFGNSWNEKEQALTAKVQELSEFTEALQNALVVCKHCVL